jgi:drug/metabolite transporter (DMT)-like permease
MNARLGAAAMVGSAACWGLATVMTKGLLERVPPFTLLMLQLTSSVAFLWLTVLLTRTRLRLDATALRASSTGLLEPGLAYAVGVPGLALTTASSASLIAATEPAWIVLLAWWLLRETPTARTLSAIGIAALGVTLVSVSDLGSLHPGDPRGNALVLLGTLFAALYVVRSSRFVANIAPLALAALQQSVGLLATLGVLAVVVVAGLETLPNLSLEVVLFAALTGIVQYALGFWLYLIGLRGVPTGVAALYLVLIPVFAVGGALVFLGETITLAQRVGALLVVSAVLGMNLAHRNAVQTT